MAIYDKASLVLIPSGTKTSKVYSQVPTNGDGDFTFSRSTAATRVNASGNIEKERENLMPYSNQFNQWSDNSGVTETGGQSGYDGTNDAWKITLTSNSGSVRELVTHNGVYTLSIYAKAGNKNWLALYLAGTPTPYVYFDLANGVLGNNVGGNAITSKIEDAGGGWYRCSVIYNANITGTTRIFPADSNGVLAYANDYIYIQDAQLEQGLVARDYIETTTTAIYGGITDNVPRLDYTDSSCPALLLEPQRTNDIQHSEYFAGWNAITNVSINHNESNSPEGVQNATEIVPNTSNDNHFIDKSGFNRTASEYITTTIYAKANGYDYLYLSLSASRLYGVFDISNGAVMLTNSNGTDFNNDSGSIEDVGNGWYRCTLIGQAQSTFGTYLRVSCAPTSTNTHTPIFAGDGTSGVLVYGAQVELNSSYATSYIPTYGSAVTRNGDAASKTGISSLIGQTEGTVYIEFDKKNGTGERRFFLQIGSGSTTIYARLESNNSLTTQILNGGTDYLTSTGTIIPSGNNKFAIGYANNDAVIYLNGTQLASSSSVVVPALSSLYVGSNSSNAQTIAGGIKQTALFNERLSNAELATLTTI